MNNAPITAVAGSQTGTGALVGVASGVDSVGGTVGAVAATVGALWDRVAGMVVGTAVAGISCPVIAKNEKPGLAAE